MVRCREGVRGDDFNVEAIAVDHPVRCPSRGKGVGEWESDSKSALVGSREGVFGKCPQRRGNGMGQSS
jgi:hypothetical protein